MSDKDDLFTPDETFGDTSGDAALFETPKKKKKKGKVKKPDSAQKAAAPKSGDGGLKKRANKPLTPTQKAVNNIMRKGKLDVDAEIPPIDELTQDRRRLERIKISDIAIFIKKPDDDVLRELFKKVSVPNRVNLSARVSVSRVKWVGGEVLKASRMYQPIQVAKIESDGRFECISGRHRLAFLALMYGADAEVLVQVEDMTLNQARDAVVVANQARKAKAMEQAEHAVLAAVGGDVEAGLDDVYVKTATTKAKSKKYCTYVVLERSWPMKLKFELGTRKQGGLATISTVQGFWGAALDWHKDMERKEFDAELKESIRFLNSLADAFQDNDSFEAKHHMGSKPMVAIGKYYKTMVDAGVEIDDEFVEKFSNVVVALGDVGSHPHEETYAAIVKAMKSK